MIATILNERCVEPPSIHQRKNGIGNRTKDSYWRGGVISAFLARVDYLGHTVSARTHHRSYRDKRSFDLPQENWIITEDTHEPIIDIDTWERVQRLRENTKRKFTTMGDMGTLNGIMVCADCGLRLRIQRSHTERNEYYVCRTFSNSRAGHRECFSHCTPRQYIEELILGEIQRVTAFAREREEEFVALVEKTHERVADNKLRSSAIELDKANQRITELDRIIKKTYEDNVAGRLSDERFDMMYADYEKEQADLKSRTGELIAFLESEKEKSSSVERFLGLVRKYTDVSVLTAEIVRVFIDRIVVYQAVGRGKTRTQRIDVFWNFIGLIEK